MGWWRTGHGDDLIGDGPADTLGLAFQAIAQRRERGGDPKPTLEEIVAALATVVRERATELAPGGREAAIRGLTARLEPGSRLVRSREDRSNVETVAELRDALDSIINEYEESEIARSPRLSEVLAAVTFVLGSMPERYLSGVEGLRITEIVGDVEQ